MAIHIGRREFIVTVGGGAAWPFVARAQQSSRVPRVGVLWHAGSAEEEGPYFKALIEGFVVLGYVEGRNVSFEHRFPNEIPERFESMAAELVSSNVDVLISLGGSASSYAKKASLTIPIVFVLVADPVASKLVDSFARPGGNVTGLSTFTSDLTGRRLQIFKEVTPRLSRIGHLVNPNAPVAGLNIELVRAAAVELGLIVQTFEARSVGELTGAFEAMAAAKMQGVTYGANEGLPYQGREIIAKLALAHRLALCAVSRETFEPGALMSYAPDQLAIIRRAAVYVDKILKGSKPSELPVEGPTKFEFLLNLKTAKALGIDVPPIMIGRADEVIE
jgi:putative ABC transport system substrate-binding protein